MTKKFEYTHSNHLTNQFCDPSAYTDFANFISKAECAKALTEIASWPGYAYTDLLSLPDFATKANVANVFYKDESSRFELGSFKALGGSYAIARLADTYQRAHGSLEGLVVATATDGNHGRSVAWGAQRIGIDCHIFIHSQVSEARKNAMIELDAEVHRVKGNYDESLAECERVANSEGWQIVSDTSWEGYETVPLQIMAGYSVMAAEIVDQLNGEIPSHFFIPAGCGGLAGSMLAYLWQIWGEELPAIVIVESNLSDCVFQSLQADKVRLVNIVEETVMAGLSCGEVSRIVWPLLRKAIKHSITIPDEGVIPMIKWLAKPESKVRRSIEGGECAAASLIALMAGSTDTQLREALGIDENSSILVLGTEGATDPDFYEYAIND